MNLSQFLKDGAGDWSSLRLVMLLLATALVPVWVYVSVKTGQLADIPKGVSDVLMSVLGAKVVQSFSANDRGQP